MHHRISQKGFAAIESLLLLVIVSMIGFTGWFVWQSSRQADGALSNASHAQLAVPKAPVKAHDAKRSDVQTHSITIKEWGVQASYNAPLVLTYEMQDNNTAVFSAQQLNDLVAGSNVDCRGFAGSIMRINMKELQASGEDGPFGAPNSTTKIIGDYGYVFIHAQSACSGTLPSILPADKQLQLNTLLQQANDAVKGMVVSLQTVT